MLRGVTAIVDIDTCISRRVLLVNRMYLASEALGLRATGIGAFFDDEVNRYLSLSPELGQVVYHFAIGYPVPDPRLEA